MRRYQNKFSEFDTWAGTQAQQFWKKNDWAPKDQAQWHNLDILDFGEGAETKKRVSELGTLAGTQDQQFWKIKDGARQDQAQWQTLNILDFGG